MFSSFKHQDIFADILTLPDKAIINHSVVAKHSYDVLTICETHCRLSCDFLHVSIYNKTGIYVD